MVLTMEDLRVKYWSGRWCNGNTAPYQVEDAGSIPVRSTSYGGNEGGGVLEGANIGIAPLNYVKQINCIIGIDDMLTKYDTVFDRVLCGNGPRAYTTNI